MPNPCPPHAFPIRVPSDVLEALGEFTGHFWSDSLSLEPFICDAIRAYMKAAAEPPTAALQQPATPSDTGYQWKAVFLPQGTRLRACFDGQPWFAMVEGAEIIYDGEAISPSRFTNRWGSGNRNAWKTVWLRFPGSDAWLLADVCRAAQQAAIARLLAGEVPGASQRPPAAAAQPQVTGRERGKARSQQPSSRQAGARPTEVRPTGMPDARHDNGGQRRKSAKSGGRRKRRKAKQVPGNP